MPEQLAIHGGQPTVPEGTIKPWPHITDADRAGSDGGAVQRQHQRTA